MWRRHRLSPCASLESGVLGLCLLLAAGCSTAPSSPDALTPTEARALVADLLPPMLPDRSEWSADIYAAFAAMEILPSVENICAAIAVAEQESGMQADPEVPALSVIAWREIDTHAAAAGIPKAVVRTALRLPSRDGRSFAERIDTAKTERELSEVFEDLVDVLPFGQVFLAERNPVRTGGPMQVSIAFAQAHAKQRPYPYPVERGLRAEVFTRRGGMYFGIAHLLDYPASYEQPLYRFADFNAGRYASRNAGFQNALSLASGIPLEFDGDVLRLGSDEPGSTERAARVLGRRLRLDDADIRADLERGAAEDFEDTALYRKVFALADDLEKRSLPRAVLPAIRLKSPKITRRLTTEWFARRVDERYQACLKRAPAHRER